MIEFTDEVKINGRFHIPLTEKHTLNYDVDDHSGLRPIKLN